jgi:hypothetical protein
MPDTPASLPEDFRPIRKGLSRKISGKMCRPERFYNEGYSFTARGINMVSESTEDYFKKYQALGEILASVCSDLGLASHEFKLYNYIMIEGYVKSKEGKKYFFRPQPQRIKTLAAMLNEMDKEELLNVADGIPEIRSKMEEQIDGLLNPSEIERIDREKESHGLPYSLRDELSDRLKMHTDELFAATKLQFFEMYIVPRLKGYNQDKIDKSAQQEREQFDSVNQLFNPDNLRKRKG